MLTAGLCGCAGQMDKSYNKTSHFESQFHSFFKSIDAFTLPWPVSKVRGMQTPNRGSLQTVVACCELHSGAACLGFDGHCLHPFTEHSNSSLHCRGFRAPLCACMQGQLGLASLEKLHKVDCDRTGAGR